MSRYAGREIEDTSPWEVGVGDFKTLIIFLRDRAEAEIFFLPRRRRRRFELEIAAAVLASCDTDINRKSPRSSPMLSHIFAGGVGVGRRRRHGAPRGATAEHGVLHEVVYNCRYRRE